MEQRVHDRTTDLQRANKELEAFCYSVSHDLRAPLRSILGFSRILQEQCGDKLDEEGRRSLERVLRAGTQMNQLIDDLLSLSRTTLTPLQKQAVNLSEIARDLADSLRAAAPERRVEFVIADGLVAEGDPGLLRIVLENLLSNAWKFTSKRPEARIEFAASQGSDGKAVYHVRDNGAGFDMRYTQRLFGVFQRLHGETEFPGTGIGLATVQRVVQKHGGRIWAEGAVDRGATFYFTLD